MKDDRFKRSMEFGEELLEQLGNALNDIDVTDFETVTEAIASSVDFIRREAEKGYQDFLDSNIKDSTQRRIDEYTERFLQSKDAAKRKPVEKKKAIVRVIRNIPGSVSGPIEIGFGIAALAVFGGLTLAGGIAALFGSIIAGAIPAFGLAALGVFLPLSALSGGLLGHGIFAKNRANRLAKYDKFCLNKEFVMIEELEKQTGIPRKQILKDLKYVIEHKLAPALSLDREETCLLLSTTAREQYFQAEQSRIQREQEEIMKQLQQEELDRKMSEASKEERELYYFLKNVNDFLEILQTAKANIASTIMQQHMKNVELFLSQISVCIKDHPEMIRGTGHLVSYYLPCMAKLLKTYEDLEKQPLQGDNIVKTKQEIEKSFETIEAALTNMYDDLFQNVSMDISSDIQVLKAMMAQDGVTGGIGNVTANGGEN